MPSRRRFIGTGAAALALAGIAVRPHASLAQDSTATATATTQGGQGSSDPVLGTPTLQPAIDLIRAQEIALEGHDGSVVRKVELGGESGVLTYDVELDNGTDISIDATTGEVLRTDVDDDHDDDDNHDDDDDHDDD